MLSLAQLSPSLFETFFLILFFFSIERFLEELALLKKKLMEFSIKLAWWVLNASILKVVDGGGLGFGGTTLDCNFFLSPETNLL